MHRLVKAQDGQEIAARFYRPQGAAKGAVLIVPAMGCAQDYYRPGIRPKAWWLWFVVTPPALALWGYFPGRALRKIGDLPKGVMEQWRRWCLDPEYAIGVEGSEVRAQYAAVRTPIVSLSFTDDEMMSLRNTESIHGFYSGAPRKMKRIAPRDIGARRIGHFGFFRSAYEASLWREHLLPELA